MSHVARRTKYVVYINQFLERLMKYDKIFNKESFQMMVFGKQFWQTSVAEATTVNWFKNFLAFRGKTKSDPRYLRALSCYTPVDYLFNEGLPLCWIIIIICSSICLFLETRPLLGWGQRQSLSFALYRLVLRAMTANPKITRLQNPWPNLPPKHRYEMFIV